MKRLILIAATIATLVTTNGNAATSSEWFIDAVTRPYKGAWQWQCALIKGTLEKHTEIFFGGWQGKHATREQAEEAARCPELR